MYRYLELVEKDRFCRFMIEFCLESVLFLEFILKERDFV